LQLLSKEISTEIIQTEDENSLQYAKKMAVFLKKFLKNFPNFEKAGIQ
jgi:hypothetical protein